MIITVSGNILPVTVSDDQNPTSDDVAPPRMWNVVYEVTIEQRFAVDA